MKNQDFYDFSKGEMIDVLRKVSGLWKRKVTAYDSRVIEDMFLIYAFDPELIKWLLEFIYERGAEKLDYLYPIANILEKKGIRDQVEAELTLKKSLKKYTAILKYIRNSKRLPASAEKEKIDEILEKYKPTEDEVKEAGEITKRAKRPSLNYFETVLKNKRNDF